MSKLVGLDTNPPSPEVDLNVVDHATLRSNLRGRFHTMEDLLETMTTPIQNLTQEFEYNKCIKRVYKLLFGANAILFGIKHRNGIKASELADIRTSLTMIERKTDMADVALLDWKKWRS